MIVMSSEDHDASEDIRVRIVMSGEDHDDSDE